MAAIVYLLCTLTSGLCALLLLRVYRRTHSWGSSSAPPGLLLWSGLSFCVMAVNSALVLADLVLFPSTDLALLRGATFLLATALLLYGLVRDND
jgi:hypothetical protein